MLPSVKSATAVPPLATLYELPAFRAHATGVVAMLGAVVGMMLSCNGSDDDGNTEDILTELARQLSDLGTRHHADYDVVPAHYGILETAMLRTLHDVGTTSGAAVEQQQQQDESRDVWTPTVRKGWAAVIKFVTQAMQTGAEADIEIVRQQEGTSPNLQRNYMNEPSSPTLSSSSSFLLGTSPLELTLRLRVKRQRNQDPPPGFHRWCDSKDDPTDNDNCGNNCQQHPKSPKTIRRRSDSVSSSPPTLPRRYSDADDYKSVTDACCSTTPTTVVSLSPASRKHGPPTLPRRKSENTTSTGDATADGYSSSSSSSSCCTATL